jgi:hypothetical protein
MCLDFVEMDCCQVIDHLGHDWCLFLFILVATLILDVDVRSSNAHIVLGQRLCALFTDVPGAVRLATRNFSFGVVAIVTVEYARTSRLAPHHQVALVNAFRAVA